MTHWWDVGEAALTRLESGLNIVNRCVAGNASLEARKLSRALLAFGHDAAESPADLAALRSAVLCALGIPQHRLAVYGTLRRGEVNHGLIADLGEPVLGWVRGTLGEWRGYPVFRWRPDALEVPVEVYQSPQLTQERWNGLDRFEGSEYRRIFVPVTLSLREHVVATIYAADDSRLFDCGASRLRSE